MLNWLKTQRLWLKYRREFFRKAYGPMLELLRQLAELQPGDYRVFLQQASAWMQQGELAQARQALSAAERLAPDHAEVLLFSGILALESEDLEQAGMKLEASLRLRPDNTLAANCKALLQLRQGKRTEAWAYWRKWGVSPNSWFAGALLAEIALADLPPAAEPCSPEPLSGPAGESGGQAGNAPEPPARTGLFPQFAIGALVRKAKHSFRKLDFTGARDYLLRALRLAPDRADTHLLLAETYCYTGQYQEALHTITWYKDNWGEGPEVLGILGLAYLGLNCLPEAEDYLNRAVGAFAKFPEALYALGEIALRREQKMAARQFFAQAAEIDFEIVSSKIPRKS